VTGPINSTEQNREMALPNGWVWAALDEFCVVTQGQSPPGETYNNSGDGLPFFQGKAEFGAIYPTPVKWCSAPTKVAKPEDILISIRAPVGPTNLCPSIACIGRGLAAIRPLSMISPRLVLYELRSTQNVLAAKGTGSTFEAISGSDLRTHSLPVPPLNEQYRIVSEIEKQFTRLDAAVEALKRVRANLKRYRASVLKAACEGRLVPTEAELARAEGRDYEPADLLLQRILRKRRAKWEAHQLAKMNQNGKAPSDDNWKARYKTRVFHATNQIGQTPDGWCSTNIEPLLSAERAGIKTGPFGSLLKKHEHRAEGVPVLGIENIGITKYIYGSKIHVQESKASQLSAYDAQPGDVLISRSGTVGEVCVVPEGLGEARISTNLMRVTLEPLGMLPLFFCFLFNGSPIVLQQVSDLCKGSTRDFLNQHILSSIVFPLPPLAEQYRIVAEVERRLSVIEELDAQIGANLKRAERLRQSILKRAFEGKLVPQDPNDEPASILLERIRAEREALGENAGSRNGGNRKKQKRA